MILKYNYRQASVELTTEILFVVIILNCLKYWSMLHILIFIHVLNYIIYFSNIIFRIYRQDSFAWIYLHWSADSKHFTMNDIPSYDSIRVTTFTIEVEEFEDHNMQYVSSLVLPITICYYLNM